MVALFSYIVHFANRLCYNVFFRKFNIKGLSCLFIFPPCKICEIFAKNICKSVQFHHLQLTTSSQVKNLWHNRRIFLWNWLTPFILEHCICCKSLNLINQFSFPVFTAFSKWCRFAMDHNLSWDIWHDKLDQAREGREKWNLYQKQTKQKFHLMMLLSTLSSSFRIEFYTWHLNQNVNLALIMCLIVCTINQIMKWADRIQPHVLAC